MNLSLFLAALVALAACGQPEDEKEHAERLVEQLRSDQALAERYYVADLACMRGQGAAEVDATGVHLWQGDSTRSVDFAFEETSSVATLSSPAISGTYFGFEQTQACTKVGSGLKCDGSSKVVSDMVPVKVCRSGNAFPRNSVEGVALTSLANITVAYDFYKSVPNRSEDMAGAHLLVLPIVEKVYQDRDDRGRPATMRSVQTDNLGYQPTFAGGPTFIVFPKGRANADAGLWRGVNLWEVPWGLAHEFGHHVFRTHTGVTKLASLGGDASLTAGSRLVTSETIWNAVNEGFADLFAYYTYGSKPGLARGVDCFETNRDLAASQFTTGVPKILSRDILAKFYDSTTLSPPPCREPNFQDEHTIGAVIAYGIEQIFSSTAGVGRDATTKKAQLLLRWANALGPLGQKASAKPLELEVLLREAVAVVARSGALTLDQCDDVRTYFPEYADEWLSHGFDCR